MRHLACKKVFLEYEYDRVEAVTTQAQCTMTSAAKPKNNTDVSNKGDWGTITP